MNQKLSLQEIIEICVEIYGELGLQSLMNRLKESEYFRTKKVHQLLDYFSQND